MNVQHNMLKSKCLGIWQRAINELAIKQSVYIRSSLVSWESVLKVTGGAPVGNVFFFFNTKSITEKIVLCCVCAYWKKFRAIWISARPYGYIALRKGEQSVTFKLKMKVNSWFADIER